MDFVLIGIDSFTMTVAAAGTGSVTSAVRRGRVVIASCIAILAVLRTISVLIQNRYKSISDTYDRISFTMCWYIGVDPFEMLGSEGLTLEILCRLFAILCYSLSR